MRRTLVLLLAFASCVQVPPPILTGPVVGYTTRTWKDPVSRRPMRVALFFPPMRPLVQEPMRLGPWWAEVGGTESIGMGQHPVVFISHGHAGSRFGHHDLAVALARAGYVVCALEHPGDNYADETGVGTERVLLGRARQVSAALDVLLLDPLFGPHLDKSRVGVAGFSEGGYAGLLLVGAKPDFTRWTGYCARHPDDAELCRDPHPELKQDRSVRDDRVRAAFVMAPVGIFFGPMAFTGVRAPVSLAVAEKDSVLLPEENALIVRTGLTSLVEYTEIPAADHYVFLAPCAGAEKICADPLGVNRPTVHEAVNTAAVKFFDAQLR
jgi:predicted dienelactone hydrolase